MSRFSSPLEYEQFIYNLPPPDPKHHRVPAPGLGFSPPNLLFLIHEIQGILPGNQSQAHIDKPTG